MLPCYYRTALENKILKSGEVSIMEIADYLNHGRITGKPEDQRTIKLANYVAKTLKKFFSSSDDVIAPAHVPTLEHEESLDDKEKYQQGVYIYTCNLFVDKHIKLHDTHRTMTSHFLNLQIKISAYYKYGDPNVSGTKPPSEI